MCTSTEDGPRQRRLGEASVTWIRDFGGRKEGIERGSISLEATPPQLADVIQRMADQGVIQIDHAGGFEPTVEAPFVGLPQDVLVVEIAMCGDEVVGRAEHRGQRGHPVIKLFKKVSRQAVTISDDGSHVGMASLDLGTESVPSAGALRSIQRDGVQLTNEATKPRRELR